MVDGSQIVDLAYTLVSSIAKSQSIPKTWTFLIQGGIWLIYKNYSKAHAGSNLEKT